MKILIVAATTSEIRPAMEKLNFSGENGRIMHHLYKNHQVDILITGIGMVATSYHVAKTLMAKKYDLAVNAGICGAFHPHLHIGEVVNVARDCFPELGAENKNEFLTIFELGLEDPSEFPYQDGMIENKSWKTLTGIINLPEVTGVTANTVHGNKTSIEKLTSRFHPQTESMEGAAFLYVCLMEKIPCLQLRAVSNFVEERDKPGWNIELALKNLNKTLIELLNKL